MLRKIGMAASVAAIALGGLAMTAGVASAAGKPTITATGSVHCTGLVGKVSIKPALTNVNTLPSVTDSKTKATCTGTTEQGVTPTSAKSTTHSVGTSPGTCSGLLLPGTTPFTSITNWKASGGHINPSTTVFPNVTPAGGGFALLNGDVTGSYAGNNNASAQANIDIAAVATALATKCDPIPPKNKAPKGIKKIVILSGTTDIT
jgi:hypothetical protein